MLALMTDAFGGYGGIACYNRDLLTALSRCQRPGAVTVLPRLTVDAPGELPEGIVQLAPTRSKLIYAARAVGLAMRERPRIIFNGHIYHGPLAHAIAQVTGAPIISQIHGIEVWEPISPACRKALEASALVLTVSRDTRARVLSQISTAPEKVVVTNNTVGEQFCPGDRAEARDQFGLGDEIAVLTVTRLDERDRYKGVDRIIRSLPDQGADGRGVVLLIAGQGTDRERLEGLAREHGVIDRVRFLGKVPDGDLANLYRAADLFALPSTGEGFGIVYVEALACGTPAIGLAVGGVPDALCDGTLGDCVAPEDFEPAFRLAIDKCRQRPAGLAEQARAHFGRLIFNDQIEKIVMPLWRSAMERTPLPCNAR